MKIDLVVAGYLFHDNKVLLIHHKKLDKWLPPGGHIEENETPDKALIREFEEETGLNINILNQKELPLLGSVKENLALPFYSNVHNVGDHDHACFFYICTAKNPEDLIINNELKDHHWFSKEELDNENIPPDVREHCKLAFDFIQKV